mmetsp:Transcript_33543/g.88091  ORF Transcript_33543/g.88091 Transcript_33543/m.88091 type:complete len:241 (-) Transcript_33543:3531-4253(-)
MDGGAAMELEVGGASVEAGDAAEAEQLVGPPPDGIDALPYADKDLDTPGAREAAIALVQEEMRQFTPDMSEYAARLPPLPKIGSYESAFMLAEMERVAAGESMPPLDMRKSELPLPPKSKRNDVAAWQGALDNACAQFEHQKTRLDNLELLSKHGPQVWAMRTKQAKAQEEALRKELAAITSQIQDVNWKRQSEQSTVGAALHELEVQWGQLVSKNYEIERAAQQLEAEIAMLKGAQVSS